MKRNINLQDLSKDHHHGLLLGWKIRQGIKLKADILQISDYVLYFFNGALLPHFREEEEIVLSYLPDSNELKQQTLAEHASIQSQIERMNGSTTTDDLILLAETLDAHIRFEERSLFPYLEDKLSDGELEALGKAIKNDHKGFADTFPNEFWKVDK